MSHESAEVLLRGYHAFVDGDFEAMATMLDPDVEWVPAGESDAVVISRERVLEVVADRAAENYHVVVDRAIGLADRVVVSMRFSRIELDPSDERPLQSRRSYLLGRWAGRRLHARRPGRARRGAPASRGGSRGCGTRS